MWDKPKIIAESPEGGYWKPVNHWKDLPSSLKAEADEIAARLTGERPSVYYEVGFAHALGRRVILFRKTGTQIHFDLAAYNCPEYENLSKLHSMLMKRLESLTGRPPRKKS